MPGTRPGRAVAEMASFMDMALEEDPAAGGGGGVPVGCVIVRTGAAVARAGNRTLADRDPTAHAEIVAIRAAGAVLGSERLAELGLYVTPRPGRRMPRSSPSAPPALSLARSGWRIAISTSRSSRARCAPAPSRSRV